MTLYALHTLGEFLSRGLSLAPLPFRCDEDQAFFCKITAGIRAEVVKLKVRRPEVRVFVHLTVPLGSRF